MRSLYSTGADVSVKGNLSLYRSDETTLPRGPSNPLSSDLNVGRLDFTGD